MPNTFILGLNRPLGTLKATHNATASTTSQFHTTNADATDVAIGDKVRCYNVFIFSYTFLGEVIITNKQIDTPVVGVTRFTVSPIFSIVPTTGAEMYRPDVIDPAVFTNPQMDKLDQVMDAVLCTPGTRPGIPFLGQIIVESTVLGVSPFDVRYWNGSTWVLMVQSGSGVAGRIAYVTSQTIGPTTGEGQETGPYMSATFSAISGTTYLIHVSANLSTFFTNGPMEALCRFRKANGASVVSTDTIIANAGFDPDTDAVDTRNAFTFPWTSNVTGQVTVGIFLVGGAGGMSGSNNVRFSANCFNVLAIEDGGTL